MVRENPNPPVEKRSVPEKRADTRPDPDPDHTRTREPIDIRGDAIPEKKG